MEDIYTYLDIAILVGFILIGMLNFGLNVIMSEQPKIALETLYTTSLDSLKKVRHETKIVLVVEYYALIISVISFTLWLVFKYEYNTFFIIGLAVIIFNIFNIIFTYRVLNKLELKEEKLYQYFQDNYTNLKTEYYPKYYIKTFNTIENNLEQNLKQRFSIFRNTVLTTDKVYSLKDEDLESLILLGNIDNTLKYTDDLNKLVADMLQKYSYLSSEL